MAAVGTSQAHEHRGNEWAQTPEPGLGKTGHRAHDKSKWDDKDVFQAVLRESHQVLLSTHLQSRKHWIDTLAIKYIGNGAMWDYD